MYLCGTRRSQEASVVLRWGDRPDSNRLPPGPRPGVSTTSDLGHIFLGSTSEDSNLGHPLCKRGGLPLTYSSLRSCGPRGIRTRNLLFARELRFRCATGPLFCTASWSRTTLSRGI